MSVLLESLVDPQRRADMLANDTQDVSMQPLYVHIKFGDVVTQNIGLLYGAGKERVRQQWKWLCESGEEIIVLTPEEFYARADMAAHLDKNSGTLDRRFLEKAIHDQNNYLRATGELRV